MTPQLPHPVTRRTLLKLALAGGWSLGALVLAPARRRAQPERPRSAARRAAAASRSSARRRATDSTASHLCLPSRRWGGWRRSGRVRAT